MEGRKADPRQREVWQGRAPSSEGMAREESPEEERRKRLRQSVPVYWGLRSSYVGWAAASSVRPRHLAGFGSPQHVAA